MKNSSPAKLAIKAALSIILFSLGFARAAAHVDPSSHADIAKSSHSANFIPPVVSCYDR